ncbi:class F sortase [Streptomyces mashuensis]|uniref:Class F sortase n=1 Tax=Streptomyces mashuensis TaxID=33904 RepID=A0A919ECD2_9ACTN|nr:class F sortase [Streptomyces mashuensis]GHF38283.1 class F sortase [Streptomyces mashuensis]
MSEERTGGVNRLLTGAAWVAMLLALWLWGHDITVDEPISAAPKTGDVAAARRPPAPGLPPAIEPLPGAGPKTLIIKSMGLEAPVEAHGLDAQGGPEPPPYERPNSVAWWQDGPAPGSTGAAVLTGHVDTKQSPAVFVELRTIKRGATISVVRTDGSTADFTVEDVSLVDRKHFDDQKVYAPREEDRAELRLITCGGDYDRAKHLYTANVVVSAYLTGARQVPVPAPAPTPADGGSGGGGSDADA